jgi:lysozyme family protein
MAITYLNLKEEYLRLYNNMVVDTTKLQDISYAYEAILKNKKRYENVSSEVNVPWWFIGCLHYRESSFSFNKHLHNGDPLSRRTRNVPQGRPIYGSPPFTWESSAIDALKMKKLHKIWMVACWKFGVGDYRLKIKS